MLACGDDAALSHAAATALWGVAGWPAIIEVSAPTNHRRPGLATHRSTSLGAHEVRRRHGLRVTSPVRTALDMQARLTDAQLVRLVEDLRVAGHLGPSAFAELRARSARIERLIGDGSPTRSALEDRFRLFTDRHRLPMPETSARLPENGREVDALYRDARLIIEIDSWHYHGGRVPFELDREKDAAALDLGYATVRITDRRLNRGGVAEAARIRRIRAARLPQ